MDFFDVSVSAGELQRLVELVEKSEGEKGKDLVRRLQLLAVGGGAVPKFSFRADNFLGTLAGAAVGTLASSPAGRKFVAGLVTPKEKKDEP